MNRRELMKGAAAFTAAATLPAIPARRIFLPATEVLIPTGPIHVRYIMPQLGGQLAADIVDDWLEEAELAELTKES
jgi:hypothetical protein